MSAVDLSIIVPVYNEQRRLENGLRAMLAYLEKAPQTTELMVVDDGSTDQTAERAAALLGDRPRTRLLCLTPNRGKGHAVKTGMLQAAGRVRLFSDIDLSVPIDTATEFYRLCEDGADVVIGTRRTEGSAVTVHQPLYREWLGTAFRRLTRRLVTPGLSDITCGFKAFRASAAERVFGPSVIARWSFDAEVLFLAQHYGLTIREIPVTWRNDPHSKVRLLIDLPRTLWELSRLRLRWACGRYPSP